jgi:hypothetical protein
MDGAASGSEAAGGGDQINYYQNYFPRTKDGPIGGPFFLLGSVPNLPASILPNALDCMNI